MTKKKSHEEEIRRGVEKLRRAGLALDEASPDLVARLRDMAGKQSGMDLAIAFTLGKIANPAAVEALAAIDQSSADKEVKKEIRRSFFKLSQRGLATPQREASEGQPRPVIFSRAPVAEAYMSSVDGAGGRLIWIAKPQPGQGLQLIQAMVNDRIGLQRIGGTRIPRRELRKMAEEIKTEHGIAMVSIPWEYADTVLYTAYEKAKDAGSGELEHFHEIRGIVNSGKPQGHAHPVYDKIDAAGAREGAWREASRRLLDESELRYWILDADWIEPFLAQFQEARSSRLVLNPVQQEERLASIVRDTVKSVCSGEAGRIMQRRLEDMALYFLETARPDAARLALAVALQAGEGDPGPLDVSFLTGLVQKTFAVHLAEEKSQAEEQPSFIVKP